jgi:hypothetical protein
VRSPLVYPSIRLIALPSFVTLKYSNGTDFFLQSSRACVV